tara:strand:+ start:4681 stop:6288 length:1608 start_codon:yes stop_codon:yes gene_type:complete
MGIPSYFSYIVKNHRSIIKVFNKNTIKINNLYLDCNSIIYDSIQEVEKIIDNENYENYENILINIVCNKISSYINLISPDTNVFIAFDGVAPVAKLEQQRNRRYKSVFEEEILNKLIKKDCITKKWNTSAITPGTNFMSKMSNKINKYFKNSNNFKVKKIIISSSQEIGEGEHKIYEFIRNNQEYHKKTTTVIYGLDADLIMLTLNHLHIAPSMFLFRETPHFIKSIDNTLEPNKNYILDIPLFGKILSQELNNNKEPDTIQKKNRIFDYIFLCFLLGNDFLPHFPALNIRTTGIDTILCVYKNVIGNSNENIVNGSKIIWKNFRKVIMELANTEEELLCNEYKIRDKQCKNIANRKMEESERFVLLPMLDRSVEKYINPYEKYWQERYYYKLFKIDVNDNSRKQISINYLEGLEWTLKYYTTGCIDWRWNYNYSYPPLLYDLLKYIPYFDTNFINKNNNKAVNPLIQLSYVLPKKNLYLLPNNIKQTLLENYKEIYTDTHKINWAFCKYFWESHIDFPYLSIYELENTILPLCL